MPYFAVTSGNLFRCVLADDPTSASVIAVTRHINDSDAPECNPGQIFRVAELGQSSADNVFILSDNILKAGGFTVAQEGEV